MKSRRLAVLMPPTIRFRVDLRLNIEVVKSTMFSDRNWFEDAGSAFSPNSSWFTNWKPGTIANAIFLLRNIEAGNVARPVALSFEFGWLSITRRSKTRTTGSTRQKKLQRKMNDRLRVNSVAIAVPTKIMEGALKIKSNPVRTGKWGNYTDNRSN